jgi:ribosome modulation factor
MSDKPKTRAEEIAYDVGVKDGRHGQDKCPYITEPFAQYWRDGHAQGKAERGSGGAE